MANRTILFTKRPKGLPNPKETFQLVTHTIPEVKEGSVLVKTLYLSVDPYMRARMNEVPGYFQCFGIGEPVEGLGVGVVVESKHSSWKKGDYVSGTLKWQDYNVFAKETLDDKASILYPIDPALAPLSYFVGVLGMPGMTAYFGFLEICQPKAGETTVVSGAAGAVGVLVGQIAKIKGCRVVGIAGTDEKVKLLKEQYGFDEAFNYKTTKNLEEAIRQACPKGVDHYFDNVGGDISDAVAMNLNTDARVSVCGAISAYNALEKPIGPRGEFLLITRQIKKQGFIVSRWYDRWGEGIQQMSTWLKEGSLKSPETFRHGLENAGLALVEMLVGDNIGKMVVEVTPPTAHTKAKL